MIFTITDCFVLIFKMSVFIYLFTALDLLDTLVLCHELLISMNFSCVQMTLTANFEQRQQQHQQQRHPTPTSAHTHIQDASSHTEFAVLN